MRAADVTLRSVVYRLNRGRKGGRPCVILDTGTWIARCSLPAKVFARFRVLDQRLTGVGGWLVLAERPGADPVSPDQLVATAAWLPVPGSGDGYDSSVLNLPSGVRVEVAHARDVLGLWQGQPGSG